MFELRFTILLFVFYLFPRFSVPLFSLPCLLLGYLNFFPVSILSIVGFLKKLYSFYVHVWLL